MPGPLNADSEQRRARPGEPGSRESFSFEAVGADGTSLLVRWSLVDDACWYWAYMTEAEGAVLAVRDHSLNPPRGRTLEIRGDGLWAEGVCEIPFEHWSLGLEAFAVKMEEPTEGWREERGDLTAFGFELDFERGGDPDHIPGGYVQAGRLLGEVIIGRTVRPVDVPCVRVHRTTGTTDRDAGGELRVLTGDHILVQRVSAAAVERSPAGLVTGCHSDNGSFAADCAIAIPTGPARTCIAVGRFVGPAGDESSGWLEALD